MPDVPDRLPLTRDRIVEAATRLVERDGHERLATRRLARELGVTAPALYDHVRSKDELLRAVADHGYELLADSTRSARPRAIDRLRSRSTTYVEFAHRHPELFRLMFLYRPSGVELDQEIDNEVAAASKLFEGAIADVTEAIADGDLIDVEPTRLVLTLWTSLHGVATLATYAPEVALAVVDDVADAIYAGLRPG